ncbi:MAG: extracellular solute-binding protein [Christensenellaceae bacterium]|nr:extracellular solute-binding protein [Christensenellaceae bacterium]MEA5068649.1 extracellular solute-binding protein [Christensenellaceae bacterium]
MNLGKIRRVLTGFLALVMAAGAPAAMAESAKPDSWVADRTIVVQAYVDDIGYSLPKNLASTSVMQKIKELTGISLEVRYTPGDSDSAVLASQLAAGNIPDVVVSYLDNSTRKEFPILLKAAKEGMFADVSEFMKNSKVYSKYLEQGYLPDDAYNNITFRKDLDGVYLMQLKIDARDTSLEYIPNSEYVGGTYIQKKIVDALGIDPRSIKTQDQFYDLLVKIRDGGFKDDNGNPVYPLGPKYWGGSVDALKYVDTSDFWGVKDRGDYFNIDADGNVKHEAETDYVFAKISFIRKLLKEGLMNPEFFTMDSTRAEEVSKTHNSAIIADVHNYEPIIYDNEDWVPLGPLNDRTGSNAEIVGGKSGRGCWAISADAEKPEEIFRFFDWLSTFEGQLIAQYGVEGVSYNMVDGHPVLTDEALEKINAGDKDWMIDNIGAAFGGIANYFFEFLLTDRDNIVYFGESRPGASAGSTFEYAVKLATDYPVEKKLVKGLTATSYMSVDELADVKTQMDLLNYEDVLVQACFAETDGEVNAIIESFRAQLKSAGVERFEAYVKGIYEANPDSVCFQK